MLFFFKINLCKHIISQAASVSYASVKEENDVVTLKVPNLKPRTQYIIQIQAVNKYGKSKTYIEVIAFTSGPYILK